MPANLNALIRYKQIDVCLRNKYVNCTILRMQEKCSEMLQEHRGIYKLVSERTIREDLRVMRSSALGFNAPIIVSDGVYRYSTDTYSIFNTAISDMDLLARVLTLLETEKDNIKNPDLSKVLNDLKQVLLTDNLISSSSFTESESMRQDMDILEAPRFFTAKPSKKKKAQATTFSLLWKKVLELV